MKPLFSFREFVRCGVEYELEKRLPERYVKKATIVIDWCVLMPSEWVCNRLIAMRRWWREVLQTYWKR